MVVDFGSGALSTFQSTPLEAQGIHSVLFTHYHGDHFAGIPFLLLYMTHTLKRTESLRILGPDGLHHSVAGWIELALPGFQPSFPIRMEVVSPGDRFEANGMRIEAVKINHRPESLGYRIQGANGKTLAMAGDTPFDENLIRLMDGMDTGVLEASLAKRDPSRDSHTSCEEIQANRSLLNVGRLYFTHMNREAFECMEKAFPGMCLTDGQRIEL